jgi:hypothetical protein
MASGTAVDDAQPDNALIKRKGRPKKDRGESPQQTLSVSLKRVHSALDQVLFNMHTVRI